MRIYFRTLKSKKLRTARGKQEITNKKQRRRQRMINVSIYKLSPSTVCTNFCSYFVES